MFLYSIWLDLTWPDKNDLLTKNNRLLCGKNDSTLLTQENAIGVPVKNKNKNEKQK